MSEVEFNSPPEFVRSLPETIANEELNRVIRNALNEAVNSENREDYETAQEYGEAVAEEFYQLIGTGAIASELEEIAEELPLEYLGETNVYQTALQYVDRVDYQCYAHPAILSPLMALRGSDGGTYYVGTDKMAHFVQQAYDYYFIYRTVEEDQPGLGELYARCWGLWGEGIELTDDYIREYLESNNLPFEDESVQRIREDINTFMEDSDTVTYLSPNPEFVKDWVVFRWLAHRLVRTHQFGVYGSATTGIISYADVAVNEAGFKFYLSLIENPEAMAENFDITDYVTPEWDEEILRSELSEVIEERIEEAKGNDIRWPFVYGYDIGFAGPPWTFQASLPVLYHMWENLEWRLRLGASMPFSIEEQILAYKTQGLVSLDMAMRISGLHFVDLTFNFGFSKDLASDTPIDGFHPSIEMNYEIMALGWTSIRTGFRFDFIDYTTSWVLGLMTIWR